MSKFVFYILLLHLFTLHPSTTNHFNDDMVSYKGYRVYKVREEGFTAPMISIPNGKDRPSVLSERFEYGREKMPYVVRSYLIPGSLDSHFREVLDGLGVKYMIVIEDLQKEIEEEKQDNGPRKTCTKLNVTKKYFSYDEIILFLGRVGKVKNPKNGEPLAIVEPIGKSFEGREMHIIKISSDHSANKPIIFMEAGMHAREWTAISTALYTIHQLVYNHTHTAIHLDDIDYYIIPVSNPDGYEFSRTKDRLWRKTRSLHKGHYGVDGNRNFGFHWGEKGASSNPASEIYRGPFPFSELETQNIRNVGEKYRNRINVFVSIHAYGPCIVYPWGYRLCGAPQTNIMKRIAKEASEAIRQYSGTYFTYGPSSKVLYEASGGSDDYFKGALGVDLSYTFEISSANKSSFIVPPSYIHAIASEAFEGFKTVAKNAAAYQKNTTKQTSKCSITNIIYYF